MKTLLFFLSTIPLIAQDWPQWRGPNVNNHAHKDANPPLEWSRDKNVKWKTPIPGRGHSSPIVIGGRIYITTATNNTQALISIDRKTGKILWNKKIHQGSVPTELHRENSAASATPQWDGTNILVTFQNNRKIKTTSVSPEGKIAWTKIVGPYLPGKPFGFGSTPVLYKNTLIISVGTHKGGYLTAIKTSNGQPVWKTKRAGCDYWATPVVAHVAGKKQLLLSGNQLVSSYNPDTGKLLWETAAGSRAMCGTIVWTDNMIFASGGHPKKETVGIFADGSGKVLWKNSVKCYEQSLLSYRGYIYGVADTGKTYCWDPKTGEEKWVQRIGRGGVMASPVAVGDHIFATIKKGTTIIFKANHNKFEKVAENQLGTDTYATPVILETEIFIRAATSTQGDRQEHLYCISK